jgi:hypothetical protein
VIMDNLSANRTPTIRAWAKRHKVELCLTPTSASWANPIKAQFGPLRTFVMGNSDHPNHPALARKLQAYLRSRNASALAGRGRLGSERSGTEEPHGRRRTAAAAVRARGPGVSSVWS